MKKITPILCLLILFLVQFSFAQNTLTVTTLDDESDSGATIGSPGGNGLSLREAISLSLSGDKVVFSNSLSGGTLTLTIAAGRDLDFSNKTLTIDGDTNGDGAPDITITGGTVDRVFDVFGGSATNLTLNSLNIINSTGITNNGSDIDVVPTPFAGQNSGGGISIFGNSAGDRVSVTINKCRIKGNISQEDGGGIDAENANLDILNSLISENALSGDSNADDGAGLRIAASVVTITNSTVAFNTAENPAGTGDGDADTIAGRGGFDIVSGSTLTITNSTISGNVGRDDTTTEGDEITITGGSSPSTVTITNSIIGGEAQRNATNNDITNDGSLTIDSNTFVTQSIVNNGTLIGTATQSNLAGIFDSTVTSNFTAPNALQLNGGVIETIKLASGITAGAMPVLSTLGVEEKSLNNYVSIYPNPVLNELLIKTNNLNVEKVELFNVLSKSINALNIDNELINVSNISPGIYLLSIKTDKGTLTKRIIKN